MMSTASLDKDLGYDTLCSRIELNNSSSSSPSKGGYVKKKGKMEKKCLNKWIKKAFCQAKSSEDIGMVRCWKRLRSTAITNSIPRPYISGWNCCRFFVFADALRVLLSFAFTFDVKIQFNLDLIETLGKEYSLISSGGELTVIKCHTTSKKFDSNILTCPASIS